MNRNLILIYVVFYFMFTALSLKEVNPNDPNTIVEAEFALNELKHLSDSGIYSTLSLVEVLSASLSEGTYYKNLILKLVLQSPYYASGNETEVFEMVVMTHKEDAIKTIAIDEFPVMKEDIIERFLINKTESRRKEKKEALRQLELEHVLLSSFESEKDSFSVFGDPETILSTLEYIDTTDMKQYRRMYSESLMPRLPEPILSEEKILADLSLIQIFQMSIKTTETTDYKLGRSKQILNAVANRVMKKNKSLHHSIQTTKVHTEL